MFLPHLTLTLCTLLQVKGRIQDVPQFGLSNGTLFNLLGRRVDRYKSQRQSHSCHKVQQGGGSFDLRHGLLSRESLNLLVLKVRPSDHLLSTRNAEIVVQALDHYPRSANYLFGIGKTSNVRRRSYYACGRAISLTDGACNDLWLSTALKSHVNAS